MSGLDFNPRPPRGGRPPINTNISKRLYFNPRPPRGGRRCFKGSVAGYMIISIHALREEGDVIDTERKKVKALISIHALREEGDVNLLCKIFVVLLISIHALREEGDGSMPRSVCIFWIFQSTPSARRATCKCFLDRDVLQHFNPRPPRGGRRLDTAWDGVTSVFQSTPSARRATNKGQQ